MMAAHPVDQDIIETLDSFRTQLFASLKGDNDILSSFVSAWDAFEATVANCIHDLQVETVERVYSFSSMVGSVVQGFARALSLVDGICLDAPDLLDDASNVAAGDTGRGGSPPAPYMEIASRWLVRNIHNPYPSLKLRESMATQTNSLRKGIDNWFLDARKRVGWTDMRRKYFNNKQVDIVDAAKRFFLNTDPSRPLQPIVESDFASIQLRARELYSDKFEESPLAARLNIIDTAPGHKANAGIRLYKRRAFSTHGAACSYPSPLSSPVGSSMSLAPTPTPSFVNLPLAVSKRRSSVLSEFNDGEERPLKRQRYSPSLLPSPPLKGFRSSKLGQNPSQAKKRRPASSTTPEALLPSPVSSTFDETEFQPPHYPAAHTLKRKRRLSDPEGLPSPKRAHSASESTASGTPYQLRLEADSSPLPVGPASHAIVEEFDWDQLLDFSTLPPPASLLSVDDITGPIDVSLFEFNPSWEQYGYGALDLSQETVPSASSASLSNIAAISFSAQPANALADGLSLFEWNPHSEPLGFLEEPLSTKATGLYNLPNISSDFVPLAVAPISSSTNSDRLPTFPIPAQLTPQEILAQATASEPTVTISRSALEAKEEQLRVLQAQIAALTAEIASAS